MSTTIIYVHVNTILDFIIEKNVSVLCQSELACLHQTVNMVVFRLKVRQMPTQKGDHSCKCRELSLKREEGI